MRVTVMSVFLWVLFVAAQIDARPQELGLTKATQAGIAKVEDASDARNNSTSRTIASIKAKEVGSRYKASSSASRNIHEFYSRLYHGGFTPGIINSIKSSSSRGFRLPQNWPNLNPTKINSVSLNNNSRAESYNLKLIKNENATRYSGNFNRGDNSYIYLKEKIYPIIRKNSVERVTTKPTSIKNQLVIKSKPKPSQIFFIKQLTPINLNNSKKINQKFNQIISNNKSFTTNNPLYSTVLLKNWPNDPPRDTQDLINYEKYTTFRDDIELQTPTTFKIKPNNPNTSNYVQINSMTTESLPLNFGTNNEPSINPGVQEIIQWLQLPPFTTPHNQTVTTQEIKSGETYTNIFNPNKPLSTSNPIYDYDESVNDFYLPLESPTTSSASHYQSIDSVTAVPNYSIETATFLHSVTTLVNDVISSSDPMIPQRRPVFRPSSEISQNTVVHIINPSSKKPNVTVSEGQIPEQNVSNIQPNVHIMFASQDENSSQENLKDTFGDSDCPTITINSITRVNNTIASKEGCTDLNIIINSQILSTNNFNVNGGSGLDESGQDKYVDNQESFSTNYSPILSDDQLLINNPSASTFSDPDRDDLNDSDDEESGNNAPYDVNQETNIELGDELPVEATFSEDSDTSGLENPPTAVADDISGGSSVVGQSNDAVIPGAAGQSPGGSAVSNVGDATSGLVESGGTTALSNVNNDDGDDDYDYGDDFELSPGGIMEGISSVFTYFTFLNPLNYGIFSLAAAPFAALTAGIFGVAAIFFPWAFTSGLDFARANKNTLCFRPNLEQVVKQSIHYYRTFPEVVLPSSNGERDLKGYQYMDNSLRTVATQLLNVSSNEESNLKDNNRLDKVESKLGLLIRKPDNPATGEISSNRNYFNDNVRSDTVASDMVDVSFDRSTNSKYNYFKTSHPGEAMAISEEELEHELASSMTTQKRKPTTTGGISTWILLNPPSTTAKSLIIDKSKEANNPKENQKKTTLNLVKPTVSTVKLEPIIKADSSTPSIQKNSFTRISSLKGSNKQNPTTLNPKKSTTDITFYTTMKSVTLGNTFDSTLMSTTTKDVEDDLIMSKVTTKRIISPNRTTKPAITTPKTTTIISQLTVNKSSRPNNVNQSTKSNVVQKTVTSKPPEFMKNSMNATSKIEKVTFKPVQMITTPKNTIQQSVPMFVAKLQASLHTDSNSNVPSISLASIDSTPFKNDISTSNATLNNRVQAPLKQKPSKPNNVLNVQLKKPVDTHTKIEVQPIKVNPPVLTIEKIGEPKKDISIDVDKPIAMGDSKIDVKFIFNPELTKIVETPTGSTTAASTTTPATTTITTTKRPKQKRKKNKNRRRRPSTSTTSSSINTSAIATTLIIDSNNIDENQQQISDNAATGTSLQESKIVPESEILSNATKNKKKQVDKPITSQIYSFLSREVMPSFGVMSLVGLGLGLASYFLYPFGGTISRRNYEVQPNYKYNLNEYGGNYGQSEEEVFSKVLQGMAASDGKYGGMKDYENNYYRYQAYDGAYTDPSYTTRRGDVRHPSSSVPIYRPVNTPMSYNSKYRKNEFQYSDLSTTPSYYERRTESGFIKSPASADRQFVVGNVPKGYSYEDKSSSKLTTTTESIQTDFEKQIAQSLKFAENPVNIPSNFEQPEAQALKANEGYEEIEMAPTAVVVEHGPRSLKLEKVEVSAEQMSDVKNVKKIRRKRESVIQQIPTRTEIEKMEDEEDLSNEILDIIDSAIPTMTSGMEQMKIERDTPRVEENIESQDENNKNKSISTMKNPIVDMLPTLGNKDEEKNSQSSKTTTQSTTNKKYNSTITTESITTSEKSSTTDESIPSTVASFKITIASDSPSSDPPIIVEIGDTDNTTVSSGVTTLPSNSTTDTSPPERFNFFNFIKKIAEIKFRVGLTVLKHASENFAKYLGNVQKKFNGDD
ncbi:hypothetical protein PV327_007132 [Microctonus hyperodae]|nr:hypothetical protein PV327_007132 [Microctonus hyperodae]